MIEYEGGFTGYVEEGIRKGGVMNHAGGRNGE